MTLDDQEAPRSPNGRHVEASAPAVEDLYVRSYGMLLSIAVGKMRVPIADAEGIVQEAFAHLLRKWSSVEKPEGWLVRAVYHLSVDYWRAARRYTELPADIAERVDPATEQLEARTLTQFAVAKVLATLGEKCRALLVRHFVDRETARSIAEERETTVRYVEKLLYGCLKEARRIFRQLMEVAP